MANSIYQGKLIRQSTVMGTICLQVITWGGKLPEW